MTTKKILIIDDSVVYRHSLMTALSDEKKFHVVGAVKNGQEALDFILKNPVDLITLDIEMPIMNGHELIKRLRQFTNKPKIIVFTSLDAAGAGNAFLALEEGAEDFVTKIETHGNIDKGIEEIKKILIPKIKSLLEIDGQTSSESVHKVQESVNRDALIGKVILNTTLRDQYKYILIGSSTGGPEALRILFNNLRGKKLPPILIVQHMPPIYTSYLAKNLDLNTDYDVVEAKHGEKIVSGKCYIAPGDFHMSIANFPDGSSRINLNTEEKECFVRPSANFLFRSSREIVTDCLYIVLTGMGSDGTIGIETLINNGNKPDIIIQDKSTCIVWGMPGSLYEKKYFSQMKPLIEIKEFLQKIV